MTHAACPVHAGTIPAARRWARRAIPVLAAATVLGLNACAAWCPEAGTRQGAWGMIFRCSSQGPAPHRRGAQSGAYCFPDGARGAGD
jgi:hypothetical protein